MTKGIDYSKWDNWDVDSSDDDEKTSNKSSPTISNVPDEYSFKIQEVMDQVKQSSTPTVTIIEDPAAFHFGPSSATGTNDGADDWANNRANNRSTETSSESGSSGDCLFTKLVNSGAKVMRVSTHNVVSASTLLNNATGRAMQVRMETRAKNQGDCYIRDDPVAVNLYSLAMKLRTGAEHADEVLNEDGLNRIVSLMEKTCLQKYIGEDDIYLEETRSGRLQAAYHEEAPLPMATQKERLLAKELCSDQSDLVSCIGILHELCRYRTGCVAMAKSKKWLDFLLHKIPTKEISIIYSSLCTRDFGEPKVEEGYSNWNSWLSYHPGEVEQGTIDTAGRVLNGLDKHPQLRKKFAQKLKRQLPQLSRKVHFVEMPLLHIAEVDPRLTHCIDLSGSLTKLKTMVSLILDKPNTKSLKAWKSTFLLDRQFIDDPAKAELADDMISNKRECHFCHKEPKDTIKQCSKCKTVFYCSRECQVADWKSHKKHCVKHAGVMPSDMSGHTGHMNDMVEKIEKGFLSAK